MNTEHTMSEDQSSYLDLSLRDKLALDRTRLANDRTLLAYIRTGLYFSVMGLTVIKLEFFKALSVYSLPLFLVSCLFLIIGVTSYFRNRRRMRAYYQAEHVTKVTKG